MKNLKLIILIFAAAAALFFAGGCATAGKNSKESLEAKLGYNEEIMRNYAYDMCWWKSYKDAQLNELISAALENNTDFAKRAADARIALYEAKLSNAEMFPSLSGTFEADASRKLKDGKDFSKNFSGELAINYEADLWSRMSYSASAKKMEYAAAVFDKEAARLALINGIIDVYYELSYLNSYARIIKNSIENYEKIYDITQIKYESGKTAKEDILYAQNALLAAENKLIELETQIKDNERALRILLNLKPADKMNIIYPDIINTAAINADINVPLEVLAQRPDLKAAEYRLKKAFADTEYEKKGWYPSISIKTAIISSSDNVDETFNIPFIAGKVSVNLPFLKWNTVKNKVRISKAEYEKAFLDFEGNINTALNEISYYYAAYSNARRLFTNAQEKFGSSSDIAKYQNIRYENGKTDIVSFLEALNLKNDDELSLLEYKFSLIKSENMIFKALAGKYEKI